MFSKLHPLRAGVQVAFGQLRLRLRFRPCLACGSEPERSSILPRKFRSRPANGKRDRAPAAGAACIATHIKRIFAKLDVTDRASAAVKGLKFGLINV